jgi:acyl-CoA thioesterase I
MRKGLIGIGLALFGWAAVVQADPVRIAALGDSLVHGYGLIHEEGFVPQLELWLKEHDAEVVLVNAGVSGDTTAGGAARVDWTLTEDIKGMIVVLGGNDLLRGIAPEEARANLARILSSAQARDVKVLLIGMQAPHNYGAEYKASFDAIYPDLAKEYDAFFFESFFAGLTANDDDPAVLGQYMQPDGIHPNGKGVELIVQAVGPTALQLVGAVGD